MVYNVSRTMQTLALYDPFGVDVPLNCDTTMQTIRTQGVGLAL